MRLLARAVPDWTARWKHTANAAWLHGHLGWLIDIDVEPTNVDTNLVFQCIELGRSVRDDDCEIEIFEEEPLAEGPFRIGYIVSDYLTTFKV